MRRISCDRGDAMLRLGCTVPKLLTAVLAVALLALGQELPSEKELVRQRITEMREKFAKRLPNLRDWRKMDEDATVDALRAIIAETTPVRDAHYHSAIRELGHYPDN